MSCSSCQKRLRLDDTLICTQCSQAFHHSCCDIPKEEFKKLLNNDKEWFCSDCKVKNQPFKSITKHDLNELEKAIARSIQVAFVETNARITKLQSCLVDCIRHNDELFLKVRAMHNDLNDLKLKIETIDDARPSPPKSRRSSTDSTISEGNKRKWFYAILPIIYKLKGNKLVGKILKELPKFCLAAVQLIIPVVNDNALQTGDRPSIRCKKFAAFKSKAQESS